MQSSGSISAYRLIRYLAPAVAALGPLVATSAAAGDPSASDKETSRTLYAEGMRLLDAREFVGAELACRGAHALVQAPTSAACWARGLEGLGRLVEARDTFLEAARYPENPTEPTVFTEARDFSRSEADKLSARIPTILLSITGAHDESSVTASIDGSAMLADTIRLPRKLDPGRHVIVVADGARQTQVEINVQEGREQHVAVGLRSSSEPLDFHPQTERSDGRSGFFPALTYGALSVGAAGFIVGGLAGLAAGSKDDALTRECVGDVCPSSAKSDLDAFRNLKSVSIAGYVLGAVGVAGGIAIWIAAPHSHSSTSASLWIGPSEAGVAGSF